MIEWFKNLHYGFHYTVFVAVWTIFWLWMAAWIGNIDWCPGVKYSSDCAISWLNPTSVVTIGILWGCGIIGLIIYHDHVSDNS